jgi:hypothetical protein
MTAQLSAPQFLNSLQITGRTKWLMFYTIMLQANLIHSRIYQNGFLTHLSIIFSLPKYAINPGYGFLQKLIDGGTEGPWNLEHIWGVKSIWDLANLSWGAGSLLHIILSCHHSEPQSFQLVQRITSEVTVRVYEHVMK